MNTSSASRRYHQIKNWIFVGSLILDVALLIFFFFSGLSVLLKNFVLRWASQLQAVDGLYILFFSLGAYLIGFPINFFSGFVGGVAEGKKCGVGFSHYGKGIGAPTFGLLSKKIMCVPGRNCVIYQPT